MIKYMTDGMLLREFLGEPDLASYRSAIHGNSNASTFFIMTDIVH